MGLEITKLSGTDLIAEQRYRTTLFINGFKIIPNTHEKP